MRLRHPGITLLDRTLRVLPLLTLAMLLFTRPAAATWPENGLAVCTAQYNQNEPRLASDGSGGVILAWQDFRQGGHFDVYVQRVTVDGTPLWTTNGVPICTLDTDQKFPQIVPDGLGGAFLVWKDRRNDEFDIFAQHINAQGQPLWTQNGLLVCDAPGTQQDPVLVRDGADGVLLAWRDYRNGSLARLYGQRLNAAGQALWTANGLPLVNVDGQYDESIASDGAGGAIVVFYDYRSGTSWDIWAQRVDGNGARLWGNGGTALCTAAGHQYYPQVIPDGAGGILTTWWDERGGAGADIYAARVTAAGALASGWPVNGKAICTAPWEQFSPTLTSDGADGAIITWYDQRETIEIYAQRVSGAGVTGWAQDGVRLCNSSGAWPVVTTDQAGGALVAWYGTPASNGLDVLAQHVTGTGSLYSGWTLSGQPISAAPNDQYKPAILTDGAGGAFVAWQDMRTDVGDIYMMHLAAPLPNLNATLTPDGFSSPVVPRNAGDASGASAQLTTALPGDGAPTWVNWGVQTGGSSGHSGWQGSVLLDGVPVDDLALQLQANPEPDGAQASESNSGGFVRVLNVGPVSIRGGRHTLTSVADASGQVDESNESDNSWTGQWVWCPPLMPRNAGAQRLAPPAPGSFPQPNSDGFQFNRHPWTAWVVSLAPLNPGDDYNMYLYDDYSGSQAGFSHLRKSSAQGNNAVDFVVGSAEGTPTTVYPAAVRAATNGGGGRYTIDQSDATWQKTPDTDAAFFKRSLQNRLADVYEGYFAGGTTYYLTAIRTNGPLHTALGISVFPAAPGIYNRSEAIATAQTLGDGTWFLAFTAPVTGWYPVVVHRLVGSDSQLPLQYSLYWGNQISAVIDGGANRPGVAFAGATPNPMARSTQLSFALSAAAPARLRLFDLNGRLVRTLVDEIRAGGEQSVAWDGRDTEGNEVASGLYFARFEAEGRTITQRISVVH